MKRTWGRIVSFLRWIFSPEELPIPSQERHDPSPPTPGFLNWLCHDDALVADPAGETYAIPSRRFVSWVLSAEKLPTLPDEPSGALRRPQRFWRWILSGDRLPQLDATDRQVGARTRFLSLLRSPEDCPYSQAPEASQGRRLLRRLLAAEACPEGEAPAPQRCGGFSRWLVSPEECAEVDITPPRRHGGSLRGLLSPEACPQSEPSGLRRHAGFLRWLLSRENLYP